MVTPDARAEPKHALDFILNGALRHLEDAATPRAASLRSRQPGYAQANAPPPATTTSASRRRATRPKETTAPNAPGTVSVTAKPAPRAKDPKRLARQCTVDDCTNYTINNGRCFRHGGGKRCTFEGCGASAKIAGRCWKHGGSIPCIIDGCERRGKSRGLCWAHGGGTKCRAQTCEKVAVSNGLCWAHGGGKRCEFNGCQRPAYERTLNYCPKHFKKFESGEEVLEL